MNHRGNLRNERSSNENTASRALRPKMTNAAIKKKRKLHPAAFIIIDLLIAGLALAIFSLFYFLLPQDLSENAQVLPGMKSPAEAAVSAPAEYESSLSAISDNAMGSDKFPGKFTDGDVQKTDSTYKSANIDINIEKMQTDGVTYYVADIYLKDIKFLKTAFAQNTFGKGLHEQTDVIAEENNALLAINGDYCGNNAGPVVRNGTLYRDETYGDVLVLNYDGTMQTLTAQQLDMEKIKSEGVYQVWTFGPMLLQDGQPVKTFDSEIASENPRTAIGYYEPGHYCFVVVDGRQPGYSNGMTLQQLSELFYNLGCSAAFNLDGGQTSEMVYQNKSVNQPYDGGRSVSDIVYIADESGDKND